METLRPVIRMCSGAVWEMSQGQEVTEVGFMAANKTTPARSEITLCRSTAFIVTWLPSTDHNNGTTGNEPSNEMNVENKVPWLLWACEGICFGNNTACLRMFSVLIAQTNWLRVRQKDWHHSYSICALWSYRGYARDITISRSHRGYAYWLAERH